MSECPICLEDTAEGLIGLACKHVVHKKCFKATMRMPGAIPLCPTCRDPLGVQAMHVHDVKVPRIIPSTSSGTAISAEFIARIANAFVAILMLWVVITGCLIAAIAGVVVMCDGEKYSFSARIGYFWACFSMNIALFLVVSVVIRVISVLTRPPR